jgi:hypothetical protein
MLVPNLTQAKVVTKDGYMTDDTYNMFSQLFVEMQKYLSNEGVKIPTQPTATINQLNTAQSVGNLLYDTDTNELKVNINGTYKVVQVV